MITGIACMQLVEQGKLALDEPVEDKLPEIGKVKLADKGDKVTSPRDLMRTWYSIADQTLMQKFNTAEFLTIQDKLTDALMGHKKAQREAMVRAERLSVQAPRKQHRLGAVLRPEKALRCAVLALGKLVAAFEDDVARPAGDVTVVRESADGSDGATVVEHVGEVDAREDTVGDTCSSPVEAEAFGDHVSGRR